jgi:SAM-dependent methyltransferase
MPGSSESDLPEAWRPLEAALIAYHDLGEPAEVLVSSDLGDPETLPASVFFRSEHEIEDWELAALDRCGETVLDIGAGVGAHALILQSRGRRVTALEALPGAVRIMNQRGVADARLGRLVDLADESTYDTVLMLMNGSMLAETLVGLDALLDRLSRVLNPGGTLLMDSTDLRASYEGTPDGRYLGELHFQLSYKGIKGSVFPQLFVDPQTLTARALDRGWETAVIWRGESGRFLAELTRR